MLRSKWHKIRGDISSRKTRTAMVSASIFIGVLGVVTLMTMRSLLFAELHERFSEDKLPMVITWVSPDEGVSLEAGDDLAAMEMLKAYPDVTAVEAWTDAYLYWKDPEDSGFMEAIIRTFSEPWDGLQMRPLSLVEGVYPTDSQSEVVISWQMANEYGLQVGDPLVLRILSGISGTPDFAAEIPEETWIITGIVYHPYMYDSGDYNVYVDPASFTHIIGLEHFDAFYAQFTDFDAAMAHFDDYRATIESQTPFQIQGWNITNPAYNGFVEEIQEWADPLVALGGIAMLVSSFLVVTVVSTIVIEQKRQIGVMKSMGATWLDNFRMYAGIATTYGVIGMVPGVLLGVPIGYYLAGMISRLTNLLIRDFTIPYDALLLGAGLGLLMPFLAAIVPVILGTRIKILEAMTDFGISAQYGRGLIARFMGWLPIPIFVRHALANIFQKKGRLSMTGITLTIAVGAFMGVSAVFISVGDELDDIFNTFNYQLEGRPVWPEDYDYDAVGILMSEGIEDINGIYPANDYWLIIDSGPSTSSDQPRRSLHVTGFDLSTDTLKLGLGSDVQWETTSTLPGIVITGMVAENNGWQMGDNITLGANDRSGEFEIIGISSFPDSRGFADWSALAKIVGASTPYKYWLQFDDENLTGAEVDRIAGDIRETLLQHGIVADFDNQRAWAEDQTQTLWSISLIFNIASLVMALVGAIGLLAMLSISVLERQREIGVMRAVGAGAQTIARQFLVEGLLIGAFAWLIGIPLSYGIAVALADLLPIDEFQFNYPLIAALMGLAGMLVIATLASLWPSLSAARRTVSDILRYQ